MQASYIDLSDYFLGRLIRVPPICADDVSNIKAPLGEISEVLINFVDPLIYDEKALEFVTPKGLQINMTENNNPFL